MPNAYAIADARADANPHADRYANTACLSALLLSTSTSGSHHRYGLKRASEPMMTSNSRRQTDAIAVLVASLRADWDVRGIMAALDQLTDRDPADVALAAIRAARTPTNRTPAVIPMQGPHWIEATNPNPATSPTDTRPCRACNFPHPPGTACMRFDPDAHRRGLAAARDAIRGTAPIQTTLDDQEPTDA